MKTRRYDFLAKVWINHNKDGGITSAIRFVRQNNDGNYVVAVARAYNSTPFYCKSTGKRFAKDRMKKYFKLANFRDNKTYTVHTKPYNGKFLGLWESLPVFIVGPETVLNESELIFWHDEVLPNVERQMRTQE